eukprot:m.302286 g.302286  ORF g.302286 m.302286 type:complete len:383 (-) comp15101_c0_seq1:221-1369(-)
MEHLTAPQTTGTPALLEHSTVGEQCTSLALDVARFCPAADKGDRDTVVLRTEQLVTAASVHILTPSGNLCLTGSSLGLPAKARAVPGLPISSREFVFTLPHGWRSEGQGYEYDINENSQLFLTVSRNSPTKKNMQHYPLRVTSASPCSLCGSGSFVAAATGICTACQGIEQCACGTPALLLSPKGTKCCLKCAFAAELPSGALIGYTLAANKHPAKVAAHDPTGKAAFPRNEHRVVSNQFKYAGGQKFTMAPLKYTSRNHCHHCSAFFTGTALFCKSCDVRVCMHCRVCHNRHDDHDLETVTTPALKVYNSPPTYNDQAADTICISNDLLPPPYTASPSTRRSSRFQRATSWFSRLTGSASTTQSTSYHPVALHDSEPCTSI